MFVDQAFQLLLDSQPERQHMKNARVSLAKEARSDQQIVCIFYFNVSLIFICSFN